MVAVPGARRLPAVFMALVISGAVLAALPASAQPVAPSIPEPAFLDPGSKSLLSNLLFISDFFENPVFGSDRPGADVADAPDLEDGLYSGSLGFLPGRDASSMSLVELASRLAGVGPDAPQARDLERQLRVLDTLPPAYESVTRTTLEGMITAMDLQDAALRDLSPEERRLVRQAHHQDPPTPELREALDKVDPVPVEQAMLVLLETSQNVLRIIDAHKAHEKRLGPEPGGAEHALRLQLGERDPLGLPIAPSTSAPRIAQDLATIARLTPYQTADLSEHLAGLPDDVREAIGGLSAGLLPLKAGAGPGTEEHLIRLGAAIDAVRPSLETWSAQVLAAQLYPVTVEPPWTALPDPDADRLPLRWGMHPWTDGPLPPFSGDAEAIGSQLANLFLDDPQRTNEAGRDLADTIDPLPAKHQEAILRVLDGVRAHIEYHQIAAETHLPDGLTHEDLKRWALLYDERRMPEPGSEDAELLLTAVPYLKKQQRAAVATERLLHAVEELVPSFTAPNTHAPQGEDGMGTGDFTSQTGDGMPTGAQPASGHEDLVPCVSQQVLFVLALDTCNQDTHWNDDVILRIDTGGDNTYTARLGAPFEYEVAAGISIGIPVTINLDLGGSDTYTTTEDCAQGAACPDHPAADLDPTGVSTLAPISILVNWNGDDSHAENFFQAGTRSQGFFAPTGVRQAFHHGAMGLLFERIGRDASLASTYEAGDRSQGSAVSEGAGVEGIQGGRGLLLRLAGSNSTVQGQFTAGNLSQGASSVGVALEVVDTDIVPFYSLGALINLAGSNTTAIGSYQAGSTSQGAIDSEATRNQGNARENEVLVDAFFVNAAGPGSTTDSTYAAAGFGRAYSGPESRNVWSAANAMFRAFFIDAAIPSGVRSPGDGVNTEEGFSQLGIAPGIGREVESKSTFTGPIDPGEGYGYESWIGSGTLFGGGFYSIGTRGTYVLPPKWDGLSVEDRPRNDGTWAPCVYGAGGDGCPTTPVGVDVSFASDESGYPAILNSLWPFWTADPEKGGAGPIPLRSYLSLDEHRDVVLNGPHALTLLAGGNNVFLEDYSAGIHVDLAGDDMNLGRAGAASGVEVFPEARAEHPIVQRLLSFHLDLEGDDVHKSALPRNQGYGEAGAIGVLVNMQGSNVYIAPERAQGVALLGPGGIDEDEVETVPGMEGLTIVPRDMGSAVGILLDLRHPDLDVHERNWFHVDDDSGSQGYRDGPGRIGLLVAAGDHNTFSDGMTADGRNVTVNLGDNEAPIIHNNRFSVLDGSGSDVTADLLRPGHEYGFRVPISDPDGDPFEACWAFESGTVVESAGDHGTSRFQEECQWHGEDWQDGDVWLESGFLWGREHQVHTDWWDPEAQNSRSYEVTLTVTDSGGLRSEASWDLVIENKPPELLSGVQGRIGLVQGDKEAYTVPVGLRSDTRNATYVVDWGDGSPPSVTRGDTIDWADSFYGATVRLPEAVPVVSEPDRFRSIEASAVNPPQRAIDGNESTFARFHFDRGDFPLVHLIVDFPTPRQVGEIRLNATSDAHFDLSVEGVDPQGFTVPLGRIPVNPVDGTGDPVILQDRPLLSSVLLRQTLDADVDAGRLDIHDLRALGPGAEHAWTRTGVFNLTFSVIDEFGGRNATSEHVEVWPSGQQIPFSEAEGDIRDIPLRLVDIANRGPVRHASVGAHPGEAVSSQAADGLEDADPDAEAFVGRPLVLESQTNEGADASCETDAQGNYSGGVCARIEWGDGSDPIRVSVPPRGDRIEVYHAWNRTGTFTVNVSYETPAGSPVGPFPVTTVHVEDAVDLVVRDENGYNPLLFITLEERTTWYTGTPYHAIVDAGGDDRLFGPVAAPRNGAPSLVVNADGDDDYLSNVPGAQGFGAFASVGVLVDGGGDDRFVVPGHGQGAAVHFGAGVLVSLGGNDVWNPVPASHPSIGDRFPDTFAAGADQTRPEPLHLSRPSLLPAQPRYVQGAAQEGIGIALAQGGADILVAGARSQGFGAHHPNMNMVANYALANPDCPHFPNLLEGDENALLWLLNVQPQCMLGTQIEFFEETEEGDMSTCEGSGAGGEPVLPCNMDTERFQEFVNDEQQRYGPGFGMFLRTDGPLAMKATQRAQASSTEAGRGFLIDMDGGSVLNAHERSQTFTEGGTSVLNVGGAHASWLGEEGKFMGWTGSRAPEGLTPANQPRMLAYISGERDGRCQDPVWCRVGFIGQASPFALEINQENELFSIGAPELAWDENAPFAPNPEGGLRVHDEATVEVGVSIDGTGPFEAVVVATVHPEDEAGVCTGRPIAGPILLHHDQATDGSVSLSLDLIEEVYDGRLLPAGCYRFHAFARSFVAGASGAWGMLGGDAYLLPPPETRLTGDEARQGPPTRVAGDQSFDVEVFIPEPLAAHRDPAKVLFRVIDADGEPVEEAMVLPQGDWSPHTDGDQTGAVRTHTVHPPTVSGTYGVEGDASWTNPAFRTSRLIDLIVNLDHPEVELEPPGRPAHRGAEDLRLVGKATDPFLDRVELRLHDAACRDVGIADEDCAVDLYLPSFTVDPFCWDDDGRSWHCVIEQVPSFPTGLAPNRACPDEGCMIFPASDLSAPGPLPDDPVRGNTQTVAVKRVPDSANEWQWTTQLRTTGVFPGGEVVLQARAVDEGGQDSGWRDVSSDGFVGTGDGKRLLIDKEAPKPLALNIAGVDAATSLTHPIPFELTLKECSADPGIVGGCRPGAGVPREGLTAFVRSAADPDAPLVSVQPNDVIEQGDLYFASFQWDDKNADGPPQGEYEFIAQARDAAGNLLMINPGVTFHVDREPPVLLQDPTYRLPGGQEAVKPGDRINVTVWARDVGDHPTGVDTVTASVEGRHETLARNDTDGNLFEGHAVVPHDVSVEGKEIRVLVEVNDRAQNPVTHTSDGIPFFAEAPLVGPVEHTLRAQSIDLEWTTERPAVFEQARMVPVAADEDPGVEGVVLSGSGTEHRIRFEPLEPKTAYRVDVHMQDLAGYRVEMAEFVDDLTTLPLADTSISIDPPADETHSGIVELTGWIGNAVRSVVTVHAEDRNGPELARAEVRPVFAGQQGVEIALSFDSTVLEDTLERARTVPLVMVMDDGAASWEDRVEVRIDNAPPEAEPFVDGPEPHMGNWYNASVIVHAGARDDTPPVHVQAFLNDLPVGDMDAVKIDTDGEHVVRFVLLDSAVPPNERIIEHRVVADARKPALDARVEGDLNVTKDPWIPLNVSAQAGVPGGFPAPLDGFRVRVDDGPWSPWSLEPPRNVTLPDGPDAHHWIHVEARDAVHNTARESLPVLLDRTPPEVLSLRWIGTTAQGEHVLEIIARDRMNGTGQPAGIAQMRLENLKDGALDWTETDGVATVSVHPDRLRSESRITLRDAAGNTATAVLPPLPPKQEIEEREESDPLPRRGDDLLRDPSVTPPEGSIRDRFTFTVIVHPFDGRFPNAVWLEVADKRVQMRIDSEPMEADGRLYTATVELPASRLDMAHTHRFEAVYGDEVVATSMMRGPLVTHLGGQDLREQAELEEKGAVASPAVPLLLVAVFALGGLIRKIQQGRQEA